MTQWRLATTTYLTHPHDAFIRMEVERRRVTRAVVIRELLDEAISQRYAPASTGVKVRKRKPKQPKGAAWRGLAIPQKNRSMW